MKPEFKSTEVGKIINLRHQVLRIGKPITTCHFEGDQNLSTFHFGIFINQEAIACVSMLKKNHPSIDDKKAYQLRGMAVLPEFQGQKIGKLLLRKAEQHLAQLDIETIWCNVRTSAIRFYEKNQYLQIGDPFQIPEVGSHVLMYKYL